MAKKDKDQAPNPANVPNREIIQRLNFLYQASVYLTGLSRSRERASSPPSCPSISEEVGGEAEGRGVRKKVTKVKKAKTVKTAHDLARAYTLTMTSVGKKATVKMDPAIKRTICKSCKTIMVPGLTTSIRVKRSTSHRHRMVYTCTTCQTSRCFPAPPQRASASQGNAGPKIADIGASADVPEPVTEGGPGDVAKVRQRTRAYSSLPLAARRNAGHIVFRGNEQLPDVNLERGDGVYIV
ncbi:hypothetical protein AX17_002816 [Amanita inopinata Kibby_2008]|nr:hypothetical protein AX17_002816 [Amanita inopinata Kibby_2008]